MRFFFILFVWKTGKKCKTKYGEPPSFALAKIGISAHISVVSNKRPIK